MMINDDVMIAIFALTFPCLVLLAMDLSGVLKADQHVASASWPA